MSVQGLSYLRGSESKGQKHHPGTKVGSPVPPEQFLHTQSPCHVLEISASSRLKTSCVNEELAICFIPGCKTQFLS